MSDGDEPKPTEAEIEQMSYRLDVLFNAVGPNCAYRLARALLDELAAAHGVELLASIERIRGHFPKRERSEMHSWLEKIAKGEVY
jgi:hypothetical protein